MTAAALEQRLRTGEAMIVATTDPSERARLEAFWLELLRRYEAVCDAERAQRERQPA